MFPTNLIHKYIILELTYKTLLFDKSNLSALKTSYALEEWFNHAADIIHNELIEHKKECLKHKVVFVKSNKQDNEMTMFAFSINKKIEQRNYSNVALRNWTNEEVKRLLGLPYRTN